MTRRETTKDDSLPEGRLWEYPLRGYLSLFLSLSLHPSFKCISFILFYDSWESIFLCFKLEGTKILPIDTIVCSPCFPSLPLKSLCEALALLSITFDSSSLDSIPDAMKMPLRVSQAVKRSMFQEV